MIQLKTHSLGHSTRLAVSHDTATLAMAGATPLHRLLSRKAGQNRFMMTNVRPRNAAIGNVASRTVCSASVQVREMIEFLCRIKDSCFTDAI
jgi:hypothetical protein